MGLIQNDCIIVTPICEDDTFEKEYDKWLEENAENIRFKRLFVKSIDYYGALQIAMMPDGIKESWDEEINELREKFKEFLRIERNETLVRFIHIRFGENLSTIEESLHCY